MRPAPGGIEAGTIVVGKYRVESILGQGGMGMVYRAMHLALGEEVALKILRRDVSLDAETVERFLREAQAAVKLKSEHVARILDVGELEDGLPFMVMEFLHGADLGQMVDAHGAMSTPVAVDLVLQACDAIVEAHSLGIVHRDVKPNNLFVSFRPDQSPIVKVLDFGISKSANGSDLSLTQTQSMLGTPAYMSPEQMRSARRVDARTDLWSIGTVLYELVEARRPFDAASFSEMCVMVAVDPPARMTMAPELEPIIVRCLAKNPDDRHAHVGELMRELSAFAGNPEAAAHYVKRAYRTLGLGVPAAMESSPFLRPSYPSLASAPTPMAVHDAASAAMAGAGRATPHRTALVDPTRTVQDGPDLRRSSRGAWLGAMVAITLGVVGALAYLKLTADEPTAAAATPPMAPAMSADPAGRAAASAAATPVIDAGSAIPTATDTGSATGSARAATVTSKPPRPPARRPVARPRPPAMPPVKPPVVTPAPEMPKFDPFAAPRPTR